MMTKILYIPVVVLLINFLNNTYRFCLNVKILLINDLPFINNT